MKQKTGAIRLNIKYDISVILEYFPLSNHSPNKLIKVSILTSHYKKIYFST